MDKWLGILDDVLPGDRESVIDDRGSDGAFLMEVVELGISTIGSKAYLDIHGLETSSAVEANV